MTTKSQLTMVLDIDSTLIGTVITDDKIGYVQMVDSFGEAFAQAYSFSIQGCLFPMYVGAPEMLRLLWRSGVKLAFFSSGSERRNKLLVPALLQHVFGQETKQVLQHIAIYSRHHCIDTEKLSKSDKEAVQPQFSDIYHGWLKKDLRIIQPNPTQLRNTALMDDSVSYMHRGQEKNFLYVNGDYGHIMRRKLVQLERGKEPDMLDSNCCCFYHIFYGYAVFQRAVQLMQQEPDLYLDDALYRVQVQQENSSFDKRFYYPGKKRFATYQEGLQALQADNPQLDFMRP